MLPPFGGNTALSTQLNMVYEEILGRFASCNPFVSRQAHPPRGKKNNTAIQLALPTFSDKHSKRPSAEHTSPGYQ